MKSVIKSWASIKRQWINRIMGSQCCFFVWFFFFSLFLARKRDFSVDILNGILLRPKEECNITFREHFQYPSPNKKSSKKNGKSLPYSLRKDFRFIARCNILCERNFTRTLLLFHMNWMIWWVGELFFFFVYWEWWFFESRRTRVWISRVQIDHYVEENRNSSETIGGQNFKVNLLFCRERF